MAPAASQEGEETDTVGPAAQQDVAPTVDESMKKKIEEALSVVSCSSLRTRRSEMLQAARRGHVTAELRCLEFIESELCYVVRHLNKALSSQHIDETMLRWLEEFTKYRADALDEADPHRRNTLRRATQCFHRWRRCSSPFQFYKSDFYRLATVSRLGLPRHVAEEGGGNSVSLDWLEQSPHPSYDDFPYGSYLLMMCMIMLPYGYKFEKHRLLHKFRSETCLPYSPSEEDRYFSDLIHRNTITQVAENSRCSDADEARAWQWNVNQRQHQLLASKSAEMDFVYTSDTINLLAAASATGNEASRTPRRLALHHDDPDISSLLQNVDLSQTCSLAVSGGVATSSVPLHRFVNLVFLDVECWVNFGDEDLLHICTSKMFFLQYLSIRSARVSTLPPEIKELHGLQVLDASYTQVTELQLGVFEATSLRSLNLRGTPIRQLKVPKQILELRNSLETILLGGAGITNSVEVAIRLPHDIRHFTSLTTLATVDLSKKPANFISALGELQVMKVLAITWSFHQSSDRDYCKALLSSIKKWKLLMSLTIHCGLGCSMEFLGSLSDPPKFLQKFKITVGRFAGVPQWFHGLHLSFVQVTVCKLEAHDLEILRDLPKLKCLVLGLDFILKEPIVIKNEGFREIQRFSIECSIPCLTFESGAMPELTYLQLEFHACPTSPGSIPMGISNLRSLAKVALWYNVRYASSSSVKRTVQVVREEVVKCLNATQAISLFINGIEQDDVHADDAPSGTSAGAEDDVQRVDEITEA